jgi:hypothetical protein
MGCSHLPPVLPRNQLIFAPGDVPLQPVVHIAEPRELAISCELHSLRWTRRQRLLWCCRDLD